MKTTRAEVKFPYHSTLNYAYSFVRSSRIIWPPMFSTIITIVDVTVISIAIEHFVWHCIAAIQVLITKLHSFQESP